MFPPTEPMERTLYGGRNLVQTRHMWFLRYLLRLTKYSLLHRHGWSRKGLDYVALDWQQDKCMTLGSQRRCPYIIVLRINSFRLLMSRLSKTTCVSFGSSRSAILPPFERIRSSISRKLQLTGSFNVRHKNCNTHVVVMLLACLDFTSMPSLRALSGESR